MQITHMLIVCGGRDYDDRAKVEWILDAIRMKHPGLAIIHGGARGADTLADEWARSRGVPFYAVRAEWDRYGKAAGMKRNREMLDMLLDHQKAGRVVGVVAFPGGRGTAGMVAIAQQAGVTVWQPVREMATT